MEESDRNRQEQTYPGESAERDAAASDFGLQNSLPRGTTCDRTRLTPIELMVRERAIIYDRRCENRQEITIQAKGNTIAQ